MSEFGVHGVEHVGESFFVIGRCYLGPLRLGDVFCTASVPGGLSSNVRLTVQTIEAYSRKWDEIDEGLTARLELTGEGGDAVTEECILSTE